VAQQEHHRSKTSISARSTSIAHDLRNTLSCIRGYAQLLLSGPGERLKVDALAIIEAETRRCCELLDHMLHPAPPPEPPPLSASRPRQAGDTADVARTVSDVCGLALGEAALKGVALSWNVEQGLPAVSMAQDEARRVLLNLVRNGFQATPRDGRVEVWARACRLDGGAPGVEIAVSDTGRGIPQDALAMMFEPFYSTHSPGEGAGLGLAISKELVSRRGGALDVKSEEGTGTTFTVRLPVSAASGGPARA
jgi:signal transduction histidine kinase